MDYARRSVSQDVESPARWNTMTRHLRKALKPLKKFSLSNSFMKIHYIYFLATCTLTSVIFWGASTPARSVRFIDAVFLTVSAMTEAGLNTVNLSTLNTFQQFILFLLIIIGSGVFVSSAVVIVRKRAFEAKLQDLADQKWTRQEQRRGNAHCFQDPQLDCSTAFVPNASTQQPDVVQVNPVSHLTSNIASGDQAPSSYTPQPFEDCASSHEGSVKGVGRFRKLTSREKRQLGGIEYEALCLLSWLVPLYILLFQLLGAVGCGAWMQVNRPSTTERNGLNPFWTGAFFAISAFNNCGMALLDLNMTVLQDSYYMLLTMSFLILAGNTCFPPFLRLILWTMKRCLSLKQDTRWQRWEQVIEFTLEHPRRVYTHLFPARATWWLVFSLILLNGADWFAFEVFNLTNPIITSIPVRFRAIDGLFQAFAVRSGGFYVVNIAALYPATQVMYVLMMYLSAFPVTMTMRTTNVYEEETLGAFASLRRNMAGPQIDPQQQFHSERATESDENPTEKHIRKIQAGSPTPFHEESLYPETKTAPGARPSRLDFVQHQLRLQLGHDLWLLALACLLITLIETYSFGDNPAAFSIFNILFEIVSGYGCVGISVGVPWANYSFSGAWHTGSKLILCVVMLRGRHRGLPMAIDRAVLLPDESLAWAEEELEERRRSRIERGASAAAVTATATRGKENSVAGAAPSGLD